MTWQSISICEGCLGKITYKGPESGWMPEGWTQCGMSKLPMKVGKMALWCPACQEKYLKSKKSLSDLFFGEDGMEAQISGTVNLQWPERKPEPAKPKITLKESIQKVSEAAQSLLASGLNQDAVIVLLHDRCGVTKSGKRFSKTDIATFLKQLQSLERNFCK